MTIIGPIIVLVWVLLVSSAVIAAIVMAIVGGSSSLKWSVLTVSGTLLCFGFISAGMGVSEGAWTMASRGLLVALAVGFIGVAFAVVGTRGLVRTTTTDVQNGAGA